MNLRWWVAGGLVFVLASSTACAANDTGGGTSAVSFSAVAAGAPQSAAPSDGAAAVPVVGPGTTCGTVWARSGAAAVVIREGRANCVEALRVATVYAAAAANAEGQAVTVGSGGWNCSARVTDAVATCQSATNVFSVG